MASLPTTLVLGYSICLGLVAIPQATWGEEDTTAGFFSGLTATGSSVPADVTELPNKVTLITSDQIRASGLHTNLLEILRKLVPSVAGRNNIGNSNARNENQKMAGGSEVALRNLDTLVLINGRRVTLNAYAGLLGGKTFVDLNQIPVAAVDRIEILQDGASSIYGSDAVGGVINIILKSGYDGFDVSSRFGFADSYQEQAGSFIAGRSIGNANITATGSITHSDPLFGRDRSFNNDIPLSQYRTLLLQQDQKALTLDFSDDLSGNGRFVFYQDLQYAHTVSATEWPPAASGIFRAPATNNIDDHDDAIRVTAGLKGNLGSGWGWDSAYVHSEDSIEQNRRNLIYKHNFDALSAGGFDASGNAVAGGPYSVLFNGTSPSGGTIVVPQADPSSLSPASLAALSDKLFGTETIRTRSYIDSFDGKLNGTIGELPAGKPAFVIGVAWRKEGLNGKADPNGQNSLNGDAGPAALQVVQQWIGGTFYDRYNGDRTVRSVFDEVRVPVTSSDWNVPGLYLLDLIGATRTEHYSDAGWSTAPRAAFMWRPLGPQFTLRGGVSKAFTAPPLTQVNGPTDTRLVGPGVLAGLFPGTINDGFHGADFTNPGLRPSKAITRAINATYEPSLIPGLTLGFEYNDVKQKGTPGGHGFNVILDSINRLGGASPYANLAAFNAFPGQPGATAINPGDITACIQSPTRCNNLYAIDFWVNKGGVRVKSNTFTASYTRPIPGHGLLSLSSVATLFDSYKVQDFPQSNWYQYAGTTSSTSGTLPRWHFYNTVSWQYADVTASIAHTYISSVKDIGIGGAGARAPVTVKSYQTVDLRLVYDGGPILGDYGRGWSVALGVNNVADRMPPSALAYVTTDAAAADVSTYSPIGRLIYIEGTFKF